MLMTVMSDERDDIQTALNGLEQIHGNEDQQESCNHDFKFPSIWSLARGAAKKILMDKDLEFPRIGNGSLLSDEHRKLPYAWICSTLAVPAALITFPWVSLFDKAPFNSVRECDWMTNLDATSI